MPFANACLAFAPLTRTIERPSDWLVTEARPERSSCKRLSNVAGDWSGAAASHLEGPAHISV